jgi:hypothetical protein
MSEPRVITLYQIGFLGGMGGLLGGGLIALAMLIAGKLDIAKLAGTHSSGNPSSPIKVRGGSMTFRSKNSLWIAQNVPTPSSGSASGYCASVDDISFIELDDVVGVPPASPPYGVPTTFTNISKDWTLSLNGKENNGADGIEMWARTSFTCQGQTGNGPAMLLIPLTGTSGFYANSIDDVGKDHSERFADNYVDNSVSPPKTPCLGPNNNNTGDEDACERIKTLQLTLSSSDATPRVYNYTCPNGECSVYIGQQ